MTEDSIDKLFARVRSFGWDEQKRQRNLRIHKIDFRSVPAIFSGDTFIHRSDHNDEVRYEIFGVVDGREVAVACTLYGERCWIISARRASRKERQEYHHHIAGRPTTGKD